MSNLSGLWMMMVVPSVSALAAGLHALAHPRRVADRNRAFVESGEETYFEQRRAWEHYGAPAVTRPTVRRAGWISTMGGAAGLVFCLILYLSE